MDDPLHALRNPAPDPERDSIEEQLHALDHRINQVRQRIIFLKRGAIQSDDPETEIATLEQEYLTLGDRFSELYRAWQRAS